MQVNVNFGSYLWLRHFTLEVKLWLSWLCPGTNIIKHSCRTSISAMQKNGCPFSKKFQKSSKFPKFPPGGLIGHWSLPQHTEYSQIWLSMLLTWVQNLLWTKKKYSRKLEKFTFNFTLGNFASTKLIHSLYTATCINENCALVLPY